MGLLSRVALSTEDEEEESRRSGDNFDSRRCIFIVDLTLGSASGLVTDKVPLINLRRGHTQKNMNIRLPATNVSKDTTDPKTAEPKLKKTRDHPSVDNISVEEDVIHPLTYLIRVKKKTE